MGKSRHNKNKGGQRSDPLAKPVKPPTDPELAALREKSILPVLKDLQSSDPKSRSSAASAVANIIQDTKCRKLLLREQVVHIILTETLTDASIESRAAGWEILKLLTQEEEADFCVHLFRVDVLSAVEFAAKQVTDSLQAPGGAFTKRPKAEQALIFNIAEALATIVSALAEAQEDILEVINRNESIIGFLFNLVSNELVSESARGSSLSCMMTLTEDNRQFVETILGDTKSNIFKHLMAFKAGTGLPAVLACGVLHNVFSVMEWDDENPGRDNSNDASLIPALATALETAPVNASAANDAANSSPVEILQMALEILASIGTALQEALQRGNKKSKGRGGARKPNGPVDDDMAMDADEDGDDDASEKEPEDEDDDDEMDADAMEADMDMVTGADDYPEAAGLDELPTLKLLVQKAIPQIVKISMSNVGDQESSLVIRTHAFNALNNIAWTVSCLDFSGDNNAAVLAAWTPAAKLIWRESVSRILASDTSDVSLATVVTSLAWALARALHDKTPLSADEPNKFMSLYHASLNLPVDAEDPFQSLGVKCIGVLGQLAMDPAPMQLNREVGVFLVTVVSKLPETPAADAVEALNQLFDIYGDEKHACDREVFWKDNFIKYFEDVLPKVRAMAKKVDKRHSAELRLRADEASMNLFRFIQYKKKNKPSN